MRPSPGIHVEWVGKEAVALDPESGQLHYLNPPAALVFALIGELGYHEALERVRRTFPRAPNLETEVQELVEVLRAKGLLSDE